MTRRTSRIKFQRTLTPEAARLHVSQMAEIRSYINERSRGLYPLCPEHNEFTKLTRAIDKHIAHWTGNEGFCHSGQQQGLWLKESEE